MGNKPEHGAMKHGCFVICKTDVDLFLAGSANHNWTRPNLA